MIGAPDLLIFPARFGPASVRFYAGLELGVFNRALWILGWVIRVFPRLDLTQFSKIFMKLSGLFLPFGSDEGGMIVEVTGRRDEVLLRKTWSLWARKGQGPNAAVIAAACVIDGLTAYKSGARPAVDAVKLDGLARYLERFRFETQIDEVVLTPFFETALSADFETLPLVLKELHRSVGHVRYEGMAEVERGHGMIAGFIANCFGFPPASRNVPVAVEFEASSTRERWTRVFDGRRFHSVLTRGGDGMLRERFGPFSFDLAIEVVNGGIELPVASGRFMGVPLPRWALPQSIAREYARDGRFHFDVRLEAPLSLGLIVHYRGVLERAADDAAHAN